MEITPINSDAEYGAAVNRYNALVGGDNPPTEAGQKVADDLLATIKEYEAREVNVTESLSEEPNPLLVNEGENIDVQSVVGDPDHELAEEALLEELNTEKVPVHAVDLDFNIVGGGDTLVGVIEPGGVRLVGTLEECEKFVAWHKQQQLDNADEENLPTSNPMEPQLQVAPQPTPAEGYDPSGRRKPNRY